PPIRACLFDMDGLLIDTEDLYTKVTNTILAEFGRPNLPWSIKARLQGRPGPAATQIFYEWAQLPIPISEYLLRSSALQQTTFPTCAPLPGAVSLLRSLVSAGIEVALATSSHSKNFALKTAHLEDVLFNYFPGDQVVRGDDPRMKPGRGKPAPDIYLLALETINSRRRAEGKDEIAPSECLVFEDAVPGVESGRRAGMRVVWVPHRELLKEYKGREEEVLAGLCGEHVEVEEGEEGKMIGRVGDGWGELRESLVGFDFGRYGILVPEGETLN
ncbi:putative HAD superfamily hydrolase, partial [Kalaharituber pfeilii]